MQELIHRIQRTLTGRRFWLGTAVPFALAAAAAFAARYQLELSDGVTADYLAGQWPVYAPLNAATAFCLTMVLFALFGRWSRATGVSGALFTVLALVNYYTRDLHGSALMPQDVLNLGTAAEVMGSYTLHVNQTVVTLALWYLPVLAAATVQGRLERWRTRRSWRRRGAHALTALCGTAAVLYVGYFGPHPLKPASTYGWAWQETYYKYGYLAGTIEAASLMSDPILMPDGYTDEAAQAAAAKAADYTPNAAVSDAEDYPDIFLILSESFYDFDLVTDLQADTEILSVTKNLPNSITGHTVGPHVGGGTNSSEYEMLTSNSLMLMPSITPFNWLNLHRADSIVSSLKTLGYATLAAHPYTKSNYRRDSAWLALGFDETHFEDDFPTAETYGSRPYQTDSATYRDLEALYEAMPEEQPRFVFLVSIQSHGDYDMNPPEEDLVHAAADYGEYDEVMDEYLSNIYLTDQAFGELTAYLSEQYEKSGRRVIVAMAGDHAPSFVDHVADHSRMPENDLQILERSTPYLIWANYPLENAGMTSETDEYNRMDLCMLAPTLFEQAGLPLTDYYRYLLALKQQVPVVTAGNDYMDAFGVTHTYGENAALDEWVHGYFYLEYNNIGTGADKLSRLFSLTRNGAEETEK